MWNTQIPADGATEAANLHSDGIKWPTKYPAKTHKEMATNLMLHFDHDCPTSPITTLLHAQFHLQEECRIIMVVLIKQSPLIMQGP